MGALKGLASKEQLRTEWVVAVPSEHLTCRPMIILGGSYRVFGNDLLLAY
jgi:hypothetical protein